MSAASARTGITEFERASRQIPDDRRTYNLEYTVQHPRAGTVSVRWIYMLMIGEFARHAGHGDILVGQINNPITP